MKIPKHLAIILDGNRRFAKRLMKAPEKGHEWGYKKVKELMNWCEEFKIRELTLYTFSLENFNRPKNEFNYIMNLFKKAFKELYKEKKLEKIKVNFIGRLWMFPKDIQKTMFDLMEKTKNNLPNRINFAMAYSGRAEIVDTVRKIAEAAKFNSLDIKNINEDLIQKELYLSSDPDLIIRTSESRLSGFLLWQSAYSEIIFLPNKLWPEFTKEDFISCLKEYSNRDRRFGK
ncbi:di-trans,poly-cis-decaprenylcistransferase [Candidatus Woesearchaeota archaeon]|nr:di-trans,poly-cis-decaprenylcistransferase [Candidatus Woesearchaeota archaeon]